LTFVPISITDKFPPSLTVPLALKSSLRYGENPHQKATFYVDKRLAEVNAGGIATAIQHHGKVRVGYLLLL
jgi:phosphoribosylaminoimidazolecarboxamide formyltransferase/IMP cyclohydrolase